jgi:hypothetical protein
VLALADATFLPRADSWYFGANIPGKRHEMLSFAGGLPAYMAKCNESAERRYEGFAINRVSPCVQSLITICRLLSEAAAHSEPAA